MCGKSLIYCWGPLTSQKERGTSGLHPFVVAALHAPGPVPCGLLKREVLLVALLPWPAHQRALRRTPLWIQWLHMVSARTLPAIFIWNPASSKYGNGPGICLSWWSFSCQFWGNKPQELNNSPFQSQKPTTFMPQTLGDSNTLIPLVSAFKTQRSPS